MKEIEIERRIEPFVKAILLFEAKGPENSLPFYADGYPGIMYSDCDHEVILFPANKKLSKLILYGQTIEPIKLSIKGAYKLIVFQLYPFATRLLLGKNPKEINDDCFDLNKLQIIDTAQTISMLQSSETEQQIKILSNYILQLVRHASANLDTKIKLAVSTIICSKGSITIKELRNQLYITERTFERKFVKEIGITPKQFAKIIQFRFSLNQLQESDYASLTEIAYNNNFCDQSHFIKTFRRYSGQTPKEFYTQLN